MLKAADAFSEAGYRVRVVSVRYMPWATEADSEIWRSRAGSWDWSVVGYGRHGALLSYLRSGLRYRQARLLAKALSPKCCPLAVAARAYSRAHTELVRAALAEPADLFYGGTTGALAAVAEAGRRAGKPYALDLEDFHSAEQNDASQSHLPDLLAERIETCVLPGAAFLTAGASAIAAAYSLKYGLRAVTINNTFSLPATLPDFTPKASQGLKLYWFSQTVGPGRGLEEVIRAIGLANVPGELHLRGRAIPGYVALLQQLAARAAPKITIVCHHPSSADSMVDLCRDYDVGLATEPGSSLNNRAALSNKVLTYVLAGLAVVCTDTPGQRPLGQDLGEGALLYAPGDLDALARGLRSWTEDKALLVRAKKAAWEAAKLRWHWDHPLERGALLDAVARALRC